MCPSAVHARFCLGTMGRFRLLLAKFPPISESCMGSYSPFYTEISDLLIVLFVYFLQRRNNSSKSKRKQGPKEVSSHSIVYSIVDSLVYPVRPSFRPSPVFSSYTNPYPPHFKTYYKLTPSLDLSLFALHSMCHWFKGKHTIITQPSALRYFSNYSSDHILTTVNPFSQILLSV